MLFPSDSISSHLSVFCIIASASLLLAQSTPAGITPLSSVKRQVFTSIDGDGWYSALPAANMIPVNELAGSGLPADCQAVVDFETDPSATTPAVFTTFKMQFDDCPTKEVVICMAPDAEESLEDVVKGLSHIPVGLRQHLSSIVMLHESRLKRAYVIGQSVAMRGRPLLSDYVHIAARLALSEEETSEEWRAAVDSDSCVLDPYAQQGYESALGETVVVHLYALKRGNFPQGSGDIGTCMSNQLDHIRSLPGMNEVTAMWEGGCSAS